MGGRPYLLGGFRGVPMFLIFCLLLQTPAAGPNPINARIFFLDGHTLNLTNITIRDTRPFTFEFEADGVLAFVELGEISRIRNLEDGIYYQLSYMDGRVVKGKIRSIFFSGTPMNDPSKTLSYNLTLMERVHFVSGSPLRSCATGHYERNTPHSFCPVCGKLLDMGTFVEETRDQPAQAPVHRLSLDHRTLSGRQ